MNKEKVCLFYEFNDNMNYWIKWFINNYRQYIIKFVSMERSLYLKNGTIIYFRAKIDNMRGQRFDKQLNGERLELLCLKYENKELHTRIDEAVKLNNQIIKDTKNFYRPTSDTIYSGDCLIDIAEQNLKILNDGDVDE